MEFVITGVGVTSSCGIGKEAFWQALEQGKSAIGPITSFPTDKFKANIGAELKDFDPKVHLGPKRLRNLDRSALFLLVAAKQAIDSAGVTITNDNTDSFGVCTGTTFSHFWSIVEFDKEVYSSGLQYSNPALFPSTVLNAASSHVSIRFNIQGFNTTISTGYTSGLESLRYSLEALETGKAEMVFSTAVDTLTYSLFFGFHKLGYMAGLTGEPVCCPYDRRRNGPVLGEAAGALAIESETKAKQRGAKIYAKIRSVSGYFDAFRMGKIHPQGEGLNMAIRQALDIAGVAAKDIDYVSGCANSSLDMDKIETKVLKEIFGKRILKVPVNSIKSIVGETFSAASTLQLISCLGVFERGIIPPTINFRTPDPECDIDCVPNKARKKDVKLALVTSFGPGGYNAACVLEGYN